MPVCGKCQMVLSLAEKSMFWQEMTWRRLFSLHFKRDWTIYFYGCGNLKKLEFSDSLMQIGCGAFTGCHALEKLTVHMEQGKKSGC